ncbi:hypothetical protein ABPG74_018522 [Tetrahymena malaccensis]
MKFIECVLFAFIIVFVKADFQTCSEQLPNPCDSNADITCNQDLNQFHQCLISNSCANHTDNTYKYGQCIKRCAFGYKSTIESYANQYAACLFNSIIAQIYVFLVVIIIVIIISICQQYNQNINFEYLLESLLII